MMALRIGVLGGARPTYERKKLIAAIKRRGHKAVFVRLKHVVFAVRNNKPYVSYRGEDLRHLDALVFRLYYNRLNEAATLAKYLQGHSLLVDKHAGTLFAYHKTHNAIVLADAGVPQPETVQVLDAGTLSKEHIIFGPPYVVKDPVGGRGEHVSLVKTEETLRRKMQKIKKDRQLLIQKVIKANSDYRIFVIDGKALGAIERRGTGFLNNFSQGGSARKAALPRSVLRIAERAAKAVRYDVAGVDIMMSGRKPYVLEVNAIPQWKGFDRATGIDVADHIVALIEKRYEKK